MKPGIPIQRKRLMAVTLVVVALGALFLLVMAIPFFMNSRTVSYAPACQNILRQIESGKEQAALANDWTAGTDCDLPENKALVDAYIRGGGPQCPNGGTYRYGDPTEVASCSLSDPSGRVKTRPGKTRCTPLTGYDPVSVPAVSDPPLPPDPAQEQAAGEIPEAISEKD